MADPVREAAENLIKAADAFKIQHPELVDNTAQIAGPDHEYYKAFNALRDAVEQKQIVVPQPKPNRR